MDRAKTCTHKEWRKIAKKFQRKRRRRLLAKQIEDAIAIQRQSVDYSTKLTEEMALQSIEEDNIRRQNDKENEKWMRSELLIEKMWREQQRKLDEQKKREEAESKRIAAERAAEVKRKLKLAEDKARILAEKEEREIDLMRRIDAYVDGLLPMPDELNELAESNPGKPPCQFFVKTATCRFGNRCTFNHCRPKISRTLLVRSFFTNIRLNQGKPNEYGTDLTLEFDEAQLFRDYCDFFDDVVPEFEKFGAIEQFVTCQNYEPHMRGHVYIEYTSPRTALKAYREMNGRYYATRMINIELCNILWRTAICGLSMKNLCPKGGNCSFLHIFKNPRNKFPIHNALKKLPPATIALTVEPNGTGTSMANPSWNDDDGRNWRWSESPEREVAATKSSRAASPTISTQNRSLCRESKRSTRETRYQRSPKEDSDRISRHSRSKHRNKWQHRSRSRHKKSKRRSRSRSSRSRNKKSKNKTKE